MRNQTNRMKRKTDLLKTMLKEVYRKKVEHLEEKFRETEQEGLPEDLICYENLSIYQDRLIIGKTEVNTEEDTKTESKEKEKNPKREMIISLREDERKLSKEENEVLILPLKFSRYDTIDKVTMEEELGAMSIKLRWDIRKRK